MFITILLTFATLAAARDISPSAVRAAIPYGNPELLDGSCTFTLWQRQQSSVNYIQLNTVLDHSNNIKADVAAQRPATEFNSYTRLDQDHAFSVTGLLDDKNLTTTHVQNDVLGFELGEIKWSTRRTYVKSLQEGGFDRAWCDSWGWKGDLERRERRLTCSFPCKKVADEDRGEVYSGVQEGGGQMKIVSQ